VGGFPPAQAAETMLGVVIEHVKGQGTTLQKVVFVLYQEEAYKAFRDALARFLK
jgi:O-acetyl-ADP-ribose deacetylase (regulator of RNase III)